MTEKWRVTLTGRAQKQRKNLPGKLGNIADFLFKEIEICGPMRHNWKNFGKLSESEYHCHIKKGHPTYVACWKVLSKKDKTIEVYYVGTHENAPY